MSDGTITLREQVLLGHTAAIVQTLASTAGMNFKVEDAIPNVYQALDRASRPVDAPKVELVPAVPIRKSVTPDFIICLEDGKKLKMLKRHLMTHYGLTSDEYRTKWGLPGDYPMIAPNYAKHRRDIAIKIGLGTARGKHR